MAEGARPHSSAADGDAGPQMSEQEQLIADKLRSALESPDEVTVTVRPLHSLMPRSHVRIGTPVCGVLSVAFHSIDFGSAQRLRIGHCCDTTCQRRLPCQLPGLSCVATGQCCQCWVLMGRRRAWDGGVHAVCGCSLAQYVRCLVSAGHQRRLRQHVPDQGGRGRLQVRIVCLFARLTLVWQVAYRQCATGSLTC